MGDKYEGGQKDTLPVQMYGHDGDKSVRILTDEAGNVYTVDKDGMIIPKHDARKLIYTSGELTSVEYYVGGLTGTKVATLTLSYDSDGNLESVVRT